MLWCLEAISTADLILFGKQKVKNKDTKLSGYGLGADLEGDEGLKNMMYGILN